MKSSLSRLLIAILLSACSWNAINPPPPPNNKEAPLVFGPWAALLASCQIRGRTEDFTLTTTGHLENSTLRLYLTFRHPQAATPRLSITGLSIPLPPEGRSPTYGYNLPLTPDIAAKLTDPTAHFQVLYYNEGIGQAYEGNLPTNTFMEALASLANNCP